MATFNFDDIPSLPTDNVTAGAVDTEFIACTVDSTYNETWNGDDTGHMLAEGYRDVNDRRSNSLFRRIQSFGFSSQQEKPPFTLEALIVMAIKCSNSGYRSVNEIKSFISEQFLYYQNTSGWESLILTLLRDQKVFTLCQCNCSQLLGNSPKACRMSDNDFWTVQPRIANTILKEALSDIKENPSSIKKCSQTINTICDDAGVVQDSSDEEFENNLSNENSLEASNTPFRDRECRLTSLCEKLIKSPACQSLMKRPPIGQSSIIVLVLISYPKEKLSTIEIVDGIRQMFPYFGTITQNTLRQSICKTLNKNKNIFMKTDSILSREILWTLNMSVSAVVKLLETIYEKIKCNTITPAQKIGLRRCSSKKSSAVEEIPKNSISTELFKETGVKPDSKMWSKNGSISDPRSSPAEEKCKKMMQSIQMNPESKKYPLDVIITMAITLAPSGYISPQEIHSFIKQFFPHDCATISNVNSALKNKAFVKINHKTKDLWTMDQANALKILDSGVSSCSPISPSKIIEVIKIESDSSDEEISKLCEMETECDSPTSSEHPKKNSEVELNHKVCPDSILNLITKAITTVRKGFLTFAEICKFIAVSCPSYKTENKKLKDHVQLTLNTNRDIFINFPNCKENHSPQNDCWTLHPQAATRFMRKPEEKQAPVGEIKIALCEQKETNTALKNKGKSPRKKRKALAFGKSEIIDQQKKKLKSIEVGSPAKSLFPVVQLERLALNENLGHKRTVKLFQSQQAVKTDQPDDSSDFAKINRDLQKSSNIKMRKTNFAEIRRRKQKLYANSHSSQNELEEVKAAESWLGWEGPSAVLMEKYERIKISLEYLKHCETQSDQKQNHPFKKFRKTKKSVNKINNSNKECTENNQQPEKAYDGGWIGDWRGWEKPPLTKNRDTMAQMIKHKQGNMDLLEALEECERELQLSKEAVDRQPGSNYPPKNNINNIVKTTRKKEEVELKELVRQQIKDLLQHVKDVSAQPPFSNIVLIVMALVSTDQESLPLNDIFSFIQNSFPYYRNKDELWKISLQSALSLNNFFTKACINCHSKRAEGYGGCWRVDSLAAAEILGRALEAENNKITKINAKFDNVSLVFGNTEYVIEKPKIGCKDQISRHKNNNKESCRSPADASSEIFKYSAGRNEIVATMENLNHKEVISSSDCQDCCEQFLTEDQNYEFH